MVFIVFIHDMESTWKGVATTRGIVIDAKTGMRLIVDEIYSWDHSFEDLLSILNVNWMSAYLKISHFL